MGCGNSSQKEPVSVRAPNEPRENSHINNRINDPINGNPVVEAINVNEEESEDVNIETELNDRFTTPTEHNDRLFTPESINNERNYNENTPHNEEETVSESNLDNYIENTSGIFLKQKDFREYFTDDDVENRPYASPEQLYIDAEFPLSEAILDDVSNIEWKRPSDFMRNPQLFVEGTTRFDIGQGSAGTCWFLSTVAVISENDEFMKQIIPRDAYAVSDKNSYDGIFHCQFFRFGKWEDVYIDDYLPVIYGTVPWGARSSTDENEIWVSLLEKAFARMHGSYNAIYGGQPGDAFFMLTSGVGERIDLEDYRNQDDELFRRINNALRSNSYVTCVVPDEFDEHYGLVGGHAYSLIGAHQINYTKVLKIRNPWGKGEWKGPWSDGSTEWQSIPDRENAVNKDDGEFFISLDDFMKYFSQTTVCSLTPDFDQDGRSDNLKYILNLFGEWKGNTASGFRNILNSPKFFFTIGREGIMEDGYVPFIVQLIQHTQNRKADLISIRCDVYRVRGFDRNTNMFALEIIGNKTNVYTPELQSIYRHKLKPGNYVLIPSTIEANQEKAFLLRLFTAGPLTNISAAKENMNFVSFENETSLNLSGRLIDLAFEQTFFGSFLANANSGGNVSHRATYASNPQYLVTVTESEVFLQLNILQMKVEPLLPLGIRVYPVQNDVDVPLSIEYLYRMHESCPYNLENKQAKFMISWDVDVAYRLPAGKFIVLIFLDEPGTEKPYTISFKSSNGLKIKEYQTGY